MMRPQRILRAAAFRSPVRLSSPLWDEVSLSERQEAIHIDSLGKHVTEHDIRARLQCSDMLLMKSRLGQSAGRAAILTDKPYSKEILELFKPQDMHDPERGIRGRPMDKYDLSLFVEQCERYHNISDDLAYLARPEHFSRVITITDVPRTYGSRDICNVIQKHCNIAIPPSDVVFRFKRWGAQSDTSYVIAPTEKDANQILHTVQELAVPKHAKYGSLFGAAFLWSSRSTLFIQQPELDFVCASAPYVVFTTGWGDVDAEEIKLLLEELSFFPKNIIGPVKQQDGTGFFLEFTNMTLTKATLTRLRRLKKRWGMKPHQVFYAHARRADVHWDFQDEYEDEIEDEGDLDEPVLY
eukprot:GEMP01073250.1.p1 GENE.GEMP01073250.1~~GEMP01073250.1.p1  ORF type:complete len:373 (+),score=58.85 GEMP01073250.1:61-1119(+)